jgi:hypothetical protein
MSWLRQLFGTSKGGASGSARSPVQRITSNSPLIIQTPRIGFLNLLGASALAIMEEDKAVLAPLFTSLQESETDAPVCDVLMIYANVRNEGSIVGYSGGLRDIIREAHAPIVIVASENDAKGYIAAGKPGGYGQANLVMTLERKGANFPQFFFKLFSEMFSGRTMPMAWVKLAPQGGKAGHEDCPGTIFVAGISHIVFE